MSQQISITTKLPRSVRPPPCPRRVPSRLCHLLDWRVGPRSASPPRGGPMCNAAYMAKDRNPMHPPSMERGRLSPPHPRDAALRRYRPQRPHHQLGVRHLLPERPAGPAVRSSAKADTAIVAVRAGPAGPRLSPGNALAGCRGDRHADRAHRPMFDHARPGSVSERLLRCHGTVDCCPHGRDVPARVPPSARVRAEAATVHLHKPKRRWTHLLLRSPTAMAWYTCFQADKPPARQICARRTMSRASSSSASSRPINVASSSAASASAETAAAISSDSFALLSVRESVSR